jgi:3-oxoacyl-[acyl-carrier-protein] synthase III
MGIEILSIKSSFPNKIETIKDLSKINKSWDIKKLYSSTGINKRYVSEDNENVISLSIQSAKKIITQKNKDKIGFILFVSQTSPFKLPSISCLIQHKLGLSNNIFATDINMGCSGFIYALKLSESLININKSKKFGLIICSDTYTKYILKSNRSCRPIFSDSSASILIGKSKTNNIGPFDFGVDGSGFSDLLLKENSNNIYMNGPKIALFTLKKIPLFINKFIKKNKIKEEKIKSVALHQASKYIYEQLKKRININKEKFTKNFDNIGNTVSSSIPILLEKANKEKKIKKGDTIIACGFGVGLSWGIVKIKWTAKK